MWWTLWWLWLAVAVGFGVLEVLLPAFVFLGFAAGAAAVGALVALGLDWGLGGTALLFAVLSAVAYGVLRLLLRRQGGTVRIVERDINDHR